MATDAASAPVLERPGLRMGIRSALDTGSLLLIADAGFGKTTALQDALSDGTDVAWVRCRDAGGDAGRLLGLVVEAIRGALPGAVDVLAERLAAASEPVDPERAAAALESELARLLVDPLVLVVDDAEALEGSQPALAVVARLIAGERSPLRLAVAARRRPTLRLARERAAGRVAELGVADLVFSAADCAAYLRLARGREPLPEEVEALVEETEGWPLGVVLAVATGRGAHGP
jgi:LuxR family transcriptional regulator, maltose regulon positive regulatory protein